MDNLSVPPKNPILQTKPSQPQSSINNIPGTPKKSRKVWYFVGGCCAVLLIALIALAVVGYALLNSNNEFVNDVKKKLEDTPVGGYITDPENDDATNNATTNTTTNTIATNIVANTTGSGDTEDPSAGQKLVSAVMAKGVDDKGKPVNEVSLFASTDEAYYAVIQVEDLAETDIRIEWFQGNEKIQEYTLLNVKGDKYINFYLDVSESDEEARVGDYTAKIYFGNTLVKTLTFSVSSGS